MFDARKEIQEAQTQQDLEFVIDCYSQEKGIAHGQALKELNAMGMQERVEEFSRGSKETIETLTRDQQVEKWNKKCSDADDAAERLHQAALTYQKSEGISDYTKCLRFVRHAHPKIAKLADSKPVAVDTSVE